MQRSLFSCVTKANLDSDSAPQPTVLGLNTRQPESRGPSTHVRGLLPAEYFKHRPCGRKAMGPGPGTTPIVPFPQKYENIFF